MDLERVVNEVGKGRLVDVRFLSEEEGDEMYLHGHAGDMRVRLRVSPVWTDEQREILKAWAKEKDAAFAGRELRRVLG